MRHRWLPLPLLLLAAAAFVGLAGYGLYWWGPGEATGLEGGATGSEPGVRREGPELRGAGATAAGVGGARAEEPGSAAPAPRDPGPRAPLRGVLRDARTGEVVPDFLLGLTDGISGIDHVRTDAEGRFATSAEFGAGRHRAILLDADEARMRYGRVPVEVEDPRLPLELAVEVGPTFRFRFPPEVGPRPEAYRVVHTAAGAPPPVSRERLATQVRGGDVPWVRLHPDDVRYGGDGPGQLWLQDEAGDWVGHATCARVVGVERDPLPVTLEPCGCLEGLVYHDLFGERELLQTGRVRLAFEDGREAWTRVEAGWFRFELLPAGAYVVEAGTAQLEGPEVAAVVRAGEATRVELDLHRRALAGQLRGVVREETGLVGLMGVLRASGPEAVMETVFRTGEPFELGPLPDGEYRVEVLSQPGSRALPLGPATLARPPADDLQLLARARTGSETLWLEARDAEGARLRLEATFRGEGAGSISVHGGTTGVRLNDVEPGKDLDWWVRSPGYRLGRGHLHEARPDEEGLLRWSVELEPGWGALLKAWDTATGRPLADVVLALDGIACEPTGPDGTVAVSRAAPPAGLTVVSPGWRLVPSPDVVAEGVPLRDERWAGIAVYLEAVDGGAAPAGAPSLPVSDRR